MDSDSHRVDRRRFMRYAGVGSLAALAGCTESGSDGSGTPTSGGTETSTQQTTSGGSGVDQGSDVTKGGKPVIGLSNQPRGFNPLVISDAAAWAIMDQMHPYPTARDPKKPTETAPFVFKDWQFDADSLSGTAKITEGFKWSDGADLTAEDVAFTYQYLLDHEGHRYESNTANVKDIGTGGNEYELEFTLKNEVAAVFTPETGVFAVPILPKQVWEGVDDYQKFDPVAENGELLGAQGWSWADAEEGTWYELSAAPDNIPDEIHEGPYVDSLRFLVKDDMTALINALKNGQVDLTYESITPNRAFQLQDAENSKVWSARARGYNYLAHNMRRVPLDDRAFRQSLGFVYPYNYLKSSLRKGLTETGDYAAAKVYDPWRPDDFQTPVEHGPYKTDDGKLDVQQAREFLSNASEKHEYTWEAAESPQVTGDKEIRVNGKLLTEAHTNNAGDGGQGPLKVIVSPPSVEPVRSRAVSRFVENLNEVGIPAETKPTAENTQTSLVWGQENFDIWASGWIWMPKPHFYMGFWLTSAKADMESSSESPALNPMGYSGADELIDKVHKTYDQKSQRATAKEALATVYEDQPALITEYPNRLHATSNAFDGWVKVPGGISQNPWTYLNVHKAE